MSEGIWQKPLEIEVSSERVAVFAKQLLPSPIGLGRQIDDRQFWEKFKASEKYAKLCSSVKEIISEEPPCPDRNDFLDEWNDKASRYQWGVKHLFKRNLKRLTLMECAENHGTYLPQIEQTIKILCNVPTWTMPPVGKYFCSDPEKFLSGERCDTDLQAAHLAAELSTTYWMLKKRLSAETLKMIQDNLRKRILEPFKLGLLADPGTRHDWIFRQSNWNAVCLYGVLNSALTVLDDVKERAFYLAAVENSIENYINSFTSDGFLDEGLSYWGYGMRHFLLINELVDINTNGKFHWLTGQHIFKMLTFCAELEITNDVFCSYADSVQGAKPYYPALAYISKKYGLGITEWEQYSAPDYWDLSYLDCSLLYASQCRPLKNKDGISNNYQSPAKKPQSWFPVGGLFICRPANNNCKLGVAIKGGNNGTPSQITEWSHKHLDLGSFEIALENEKPIVDPGVMRYDKTTFGKSRWQIPIHNSYGHNLPVIGGFGQVEGSMAKAKILELTPGTEVDRIVLDLTSAYSVPELISFTREYIYKRSGNGSFTVIDKVVFSEDQSYEMALMTYGKWEKAEKGLTITDHKLPLEVEIDLAGNKYKLDSEVVPVDMRIHRDLHRIRITADKSRSILMKMTFKPSEKN